jgi:hypothetical protein
MKPYYVQLKDDIREEEKFYAEAHKLSDWKHLKEASELFLIHAYSHLFLGSENGFEIFGNADYKRKYGQFYLNLAIGLELLLKAIMLKQAMKINKLLKNKEGVQINPEKTLYFSEIIDKHLTNILSNLDAVTIEGIKDTMKLVNLRRNNIAHSSKKSRVSYRDEYRISYVTLYVYEEFFYKENSELTDLLIKSVSRSKVTQGADFEPLKIKPRSLISS